MKNKLIFILIGSLLVLFFAFCGCSKDSSIKIEAENTTSHESAVEATENAESSYEDGTETFTQSLTTNSVHEDVLPEYTEGESDYSNTSINEVFTEPSQTENTAYIGEVELDFSEFE